jgi:hypothetical protein
MPHSTCGLPTRAETRVQRPEVDPALVAALGVPGPMMLRLPIAPEGIGALVRLGWLVPRDCRDATAVAETVVDACDAELDADLPPEQT